MLALPLLVMLSALAGAQEDELAIDPELAHREVVAALEAAQEYLPVAFAVEAMEGTAVGVHRRGDQHVAQVGESEDNLVLLLAERSYFASGRMIDVADGAIDTLAYLFEALFELHAARTWLLDPVRRAELEALAAELYVDLPPELRLEALIDAQGQYVGHLLSIAATAERSARRAADRGVDLCRKLETPLFDLWERTSDTIEYHGAVWLEGGWRTTKVDLPAKQREALRADPLDGRWVGRSATDFRERFCPQR